jgi:nitrite reductase/ring-hydroxylating ferredoxin subunit
MPDVRSDRVSVKEVAGDRILFLRLSRSVYAYRPPCPACRDELDDATTSDGQLVCPGCGHRYDVRHAGRCLDDDELHLEPVPLLFDGDGRVKVAAGRSVSPA